MYMESEYSARNYNTTHARKGNGGMSKRKPQNNFKTFEATSAQAISSRHQLLRATASFLVWKTLEGDSPAARARVI